LNQEEEVDLQKRPQALNTHLDTGSGSKRETLLPLPFSEILKRSSSFPTISISKDLASIATYLFLAPLISEKQVQGALNQRHQRQKNPEKTAPATFRSPEKSPATRLPTGTSPAETEGAGLPPYRLNKGGGPPQLRKSEKDSQTLAPNRRPPGAGKTLGEKPADTDGAGEDGHGSPEQRTRDSNLRQRNKSHRHSHPNSRRQKADRRRLPETQEPEVLR